MYVNPFWLGVLVTLIVELIACIIFAVSEDKKGKKK